MTGFSAKTFTPSLPRMATMSRRTRWAPPLLIFLALPLHGHAAKPDEKRAFAAAFSNGNAAEATRYLQQYFAEHCAQHISLSTPKTAVGDVPAASPCSFLLGAIARTLFIQEKYAEAVPYMTGIALNSEYTRPGYRQTCQHLYYEFDASRIINSSERFLGPPHSHDFNTDYYIALDRIGDPRAGDRGYQALLCKSLGLSGSWSWTISSDRPFNIEFIEFAETKSQENGRHEAEAYLDDILPGLKGAKIPTSYDEGLAARATLYKSAARRATSLGLRPVFSTFFDRLAEDEAAHLRTSISVKNQD